MKPLRFLLTQVGYDLESGLLFRPAMIIGVLAAVGGVLPFAELRLLPDASAWLATEASAAQLILATIAGSMMTVVSVVYSILLVALSLASMQFSTRILAGMMRDRIAQNTLGLFVGTFVYSLLVLRAVHGDPRPIVPGLALTVAMSLALTSLGCLVWFIHHIIRAIQANHLVDRIARDTEQVIDDVFPDPLAPGEVPLEQAEPPRGGEAVLAAASGYIQIIDVDALRALAADGVRVHAARPMGAFVAEGLPLAWISPPPGAARAVQAAAVQAAFDLGPVRTMQRDVEFGVRQIVDIALKAISPAVNDPSTAATCIDHLGRLLIRVAGRRAPRSDVDGVYIPAPTHLALLDLAFDQLRQYGRTDMAVALRLMRVLGEIASVTRDPASLRRIAIHARLLESAARAAMAPEDCEELARRSERVKRYTDECITS